jgi:hypothetical protein
VHLVGGKKCHTFIIPRRHKQVRGLDLAESTQLFSKYITELCTNNKKNLNKDKTLNLRTFLARQQATGRKKLNLQNNYYTNQIILETK